MDSLAEIEHDLLIEHARDGPDVARQQGQSQAQDDRVQDRISQEAAGQGRRQEPRRVRFYSVPLDASLDTGLAYDFPRFLKRPL